MPIDYDTGPYNDCRDDGSCDIIVWPNYVWAAEQEGHIWVSFSWLRL